VLPNEEIDMTTATIRGCGIATAVGGITWGAAWQFSPSSPEQNSQVEIWASGVYQLGLLALLAVLWATSATGTGRWGRTALAAEGAAVVLAIGWTVPHLFDANRGDTGLLAVLDVFWPLSLVGLIVVGVLVLRARRWPAPIRYLPLLAGLYIPVELAISWAPDTARVATTALYLALAYGLLGATIMRDAVSLSGLQTVDGPRTDATSSIQ
jgi:hypothetical protein